MTDLPGMWEESDLINGEADMTDTQEAMREEFEQQFPVADRIHWDIDQKSYRPNNPFDSGHVYAAAYQNMKLEGYKAATAQSAEKIADLDGKLRLSQADLRNAKAAYEEQIESLAEKIAGLEAEVARLNKWADSFSDAQIKERQTGEMYQRELRQSVEEWKTTANTNRRACDELRQRLAAAELSNKQLRELRYELARIASDVDAGNVFDIVCRKTLQRVMDALAQPISTEALDAYVAKLTKWQPIETAPKDGTCILGWLDGGMTPIEFAYGNWRATYDFSVTKPIHWMPLPPAPEKEQGR